MARTRRALTQLAAVVGGTAYYGVLRPRMTRWGATDEEAGATLPGDEFVAPPVETTTRAVTVNAPADEVWPWLVQIGQDKAGLYSYQPLENLIGLHIRNADRIHEEWQDLKAGDRVRLVPDKWLGRIPAYDLPVARLDPGRALVLRIEGPWDAVWSFHVIPQDSATTRLIARGTTHREPGLGVLAARLGALFMDPVLFAMERRMLLGIKQRAEREHAVRPGGTGPSTLSA